MSKKDIPAEMGFPLKEVLEEMRNDIYNNPHHSFDSLQEEEEEFKTKVRATLKELRIRANPDQCLTKDQLNSLTIDIEDFARGHTRVIGDNDLEIDEKLTFSELIQSTIGFSLNCHNCLNEECVHRDPNCPIKKSQDSLK